MDETPQILIVDDKPDNAILLKKMLRPEGYGTHIVTSGEDALRHVESNPTDLLLLDVMMPGIGGLEVTRRLKASEAYGEIPILLVTAKADLSSLVEGLDAGADDYLTKPVDRRELKARVRSALRPLALQRALIDKNRHLEASIRALKERTEEKAALQEEVGALKEAMAEITPPGEMIGKGPAMEVIFKRISLVAKTAATVLIRGETGTGKELVAKSIHNASPRRDEPFVAINCGALPEGLLESELFGHEKGAFTGATMAKKGRFARAEGGTLFLDEIGDIPMSMQVKLLRVLQEKEYEPVGGSGSIPADVRIVAATHKDLEAMVREGDFRQDLYYRLNVVPIDLPPLRQRGEDLPLLARHLLAKVANTHGMAAPEMTPQAMGEILTHTWPGNVRELENTLERALVLSGGEAIDSLMLAGNVGSAPTGTPLGQGPTPDLHLPFKIWKKHLLSHYEKLYIEEALGRHGGNRAAAARETGVDDKTFARKIKEYDINPRELRGKRD